MPSRNAAQYAPSIAALFVPEEPAKAARKPVPARAAPVAPPNPSLFVPPEPPKPARNSSHAAMPPTSMPPANTGRSAPPVAAVFAPSAPGQGLQSAPTAQRIYQLTEHLQPGDWKTFKAKFVSPEGRVIDSGNKNISHSEGQGYGMLLAVAYGDRQTFDRIWNWTARNLQVRHDRLFSWRWSPNPGPGETAVSDPNNATDGDLLIAWALMRASHTWGERSYHQASTAILTDITKKCLTDTPFGLSLLPASVGFIRGQDTILNPSYSIFQAYRELRQSGAGGNWSGLEASGLSVIGKGRNGRWQLAPEWLQVSSDRLALPHDFPQDFGYNAVRVPLYVAWANPHSPLLHPFYNFWRSFPAGGRVPAGVHLLTDKPLKDPALPGMLAIARWVTACVEKRPISVGNIPPLSSSEAYYSACLKLLTKVAIVETNTRGASANR